MARMIHCVKLKQEAEGLEFPPYPGELGTKIWHSISKQAWANWMDVQTRLVNENRLNLAADSTIWNHGPAGRIDITSLAALGVTDDSP